jgi:hypothetical protein
MVIIRNKTLLKSNNARLKKKSKVGFVQGTSS